MRSLVVLATCLAACSTPAAQHPSAPTARVVVLISANAEWKALGATLAGKTLHASAYGEWTETTLGTVPAILLHGGYGKVQAAGSTQWAIDTFHPELVVNLGTAGGFGDTIAVGDVIMATKTVIYDIVERMGDPDEAIADFTTTIDTRAWPARLASRVKPAVLVSADQDLSPDALDQLRTKYHAPAGDWESGAIAYVAARNKVRVLILRAISDVIDKTGHDATYGSVATWQAETAKAMTMLVSLLGDALPEFLDSTRPGT